MFRIDGLRLFHNPKISDTLISAQQKRKNPPDREVETGSVAGFRSSRIGPERSERRLIHVDRLQGVFRIGTAQTLGGEVRIVLRCVVELRVRHGLFG